jgi:FixJ family two-component response regulator/anti-sigma regulatory factor (Ser/Thr protein kinase)
MARQIKILLIDDEELVREELGGLLEDLGYAVITAADGAEGLERFRRDAPDMVITDVRMPHRDGLSLAMIIRAEAPAVPVTVITGHGSYGMAIEALRAGVVDLLRKPVRHEDLQAALERMRAALDARPAQVVELPASVELLERCWSYQLRSDIDAVPDLVDRILREGFADADPGILSEARLGLRELLLNAIEHGTLGITYHEKAAALESGQFDALCAARRAAERYAARRVAVQVQRAGARMVVTIRDDGAGFDWRSLPDPTDPAYLLAEHGRGVLLARLSFDELTFNEQGNEVTVVKRLKAES